MAKGTGTNTGTTEFLAELAGTFTFVFIGAGAGALASVNGGGITAVALAHGFGIMTMIYCFGAISGAHLNPAVTFGLGLAGKISWSKALRYWLAQLAGAGLAGLALKSILGSTGALGSTIGSLTLADPGRTIAVEALLTFFLMNAVFGSAVANRNGNAVGLAIGAVVAIDIFMGGSLTGASMNPARTFGPALAMGDFSYFWMYLVGPLAGAGLSAVLWDRVFLK